MTLTFDLLTLNFRSTLGVMRLNSVQNFSEIESSTAYRRFSAFSRAILGGGSEMTELSQGCVDPTSPNLARTYNASWHSRVSKTEKLPVNMKFRVWTVCGF